MKRAMGRNFLGPLILMVACWTSFGQTNSWTGTVTGAWEDLTWSLGVRPNISQSAILVTNYGQKAIIIGANTANNFPSTLSISNLTLGGTPLSTNTLLLNFTGTAHPLQIKDSLTVLSNSVLLNLNGMVRVDGTNPITSVDGIINQDGGSNVFPGSITFGVNGSGFYNLSNGTLVCGQIQVGNLLGGSYHDGTFTQRGGNAQFDGLNIAGRYTLSNGSSAAGSVYIGGTGTGFFNQVAGDVLVSNSVSIAYATAGSSSGGSWTMQNGTLSAAEISVGPGNGNFTQVNGTVRVGTLYVSGIDDKYSYPSAGEYFIQGGRMIADAVNLEGPFGNNFTQSGGIVSVSGGIYGALQQTGGLLYCSNAFYTHPTISPYQYGPTYQIVNATNIVTNSCFIGSTDDLTFNLKSGLLQCSNLVLGNCMFNYTGGRLVPQGPIEFEGVDFNCAVTNQTFGPLLLVGYSASSIIFATNPCVITFEDSSTFPWDSYATLTINGWQGSTNGGGATRIYIGNSGHGLTSEQLAQINFNGSQFARQLPSGEIVPTDQPTMSISLAETNLVISWPAFYSSTFHLQSATNVTGPYVDVPNASDPFTISPELGQQFFRLH